MKTEHILLIVGTGVLIASVIAPKAVVAAGQTIGQTAGTTAGQITAGVITGIPQGIWQYGYNIGSNPNTGYIPVIDDIAYLLTGAKSPYYHGIFTGFQ